MADGSRGPLTVALWCITAMLILATVRDVFAPTVGQDLVIKNALRATLITFCLAALTALKAGWVHKPKQQEHLTHAVILVVSFLAWLIPFAAGRPNAPILFGIYTATTSVLMMGISSTIRGTRPVTLFALTALFFSPLTHATSMWDENHSIILANYVFHTTSFAVAIHSHFAIRNRELRLFEAIWVSNPNLEKSNSANKSKRIFFTAIAHDYRQPMSALQTYIDIAVSLQNQNQAQRIPDLLNKIQSSTTNIIGNLSDLLQLSALDAASEKPTIESVDLSALATRVIDLYQPVADENGVSIVLKIRGKPVKAQSNEVLLGQILANFLGNSIKHHRDDVPNKKVHLTITYRAQSIKICVLDNGRGMGLSKTSVQNNIAVVQSGQFGSEIVQNAFENLQDHIHRQRSRLNAYTSHQVVIHARQGNKKINDC